MGRFLPDARLADTTARLAELETEFEQARARFMADYADLRVQAAREMAGQDAREVVETFGVMGRRKSNLVA